MNLKLSYSIFTLFVQISLSSCDNNDLKKITIISQNDSAIKLPGAFDQSKEILDTVSVKSSKQIIGKWMDLGKESLTVEISKDSIFYREHNESHYFKLKLDSIYIFYPDLILSGKPYLINDTFIISLANGNGEDKYLRLRK